MQADKTLIVPVHSLSYRMLQRKLDDTDRELPNLQELADEGSHGVAKSVFSTSSAVDYASMMTGCSPGTHGIEDFQTNILEHSVFSHDGGSRRTRFLGGDEIEDTRPYTYYDLDVPWLWHQMPDVRVAQFGLMTPATYPAPELPEDGLWVSGYWNDPTSYLRDSMAGCNDPEVRQQLIDAYEDYFLTPVFAIPPVYPDDGAKDEADYLRQVLETTMEMSEQLHAARLAVLEDEDFDVVLTEDPYYDNIQHLLWPHSEESPLRTPADDMLEDEDLLGRYLEHVDDLIGRYREALGGELNVIVISCHGQDEATEEASMHDEFRRLYQYDVWDSPAGWSFQEARPEYSPLTRAQHDYDGVVLAAGPDIAAGGHIDPISCMDFAPLLLELYGHEVPTHMDGRVPDALLADGTDTDDR